MDLVAFCASPTRHMLPPTPPKILLTFPLCPQLDTEPRCTPNPTPEIEADFLVMRRIV